MTREPVEVSLYCLSPDDDFLERKVILASGFLWVLVIPEVPMEFSDLQAVSWRRWLFEHAHASMLNPHCAASEGYQLLHRMGLWESMGPQCNKWHSTCEVCHHYRARLVHPPLQSTTADDRMRAKPAWSDVFIYVQGSYIRAEGAELYILSYHCTVLKVTELEAFKSLHAGYFSPARASCVLRA